MVSLDRSIDVDKTNTSDASATPPQASSSALSKYRLATSKCRSIMANSLIQFRIDESLRQQANDLCKKLGLAKSVLEQEIPFAIKINPDHNIALMERKS